MYVLVSGSEKIILGTCEECGVGWRATGEIVAGCSDIEPIYCPTCGLFQGEFRFDMGVEVDEVEVLLGDDEE